MLNAKFETFKFFVAPKKIVYNATFALFSFDGINVSENVIDELEVIDENLGYDVTLYSKRFAKVVLHNVAEIHWNYGGYRRVAFEQAFYDAVSNYKTSDIISFVATLATKRHDS